MFFWQFYKFKCIFKVSNAKLKVVLRKFPDRVVDIYEINFVKKKLQDLYMYIEQVGFGLWRKMQRTLKWKSKMLQWNFDIP